MGSIRDQIKAFSPGWAQDARLERFIYVLGLSIDRLIDKCEQAVKMRFPTIADESALPLIGADRLVTQGLTESTDSYRGRLQRAFDDWRIAAGDWGLLRETLNILLAMTPAARVLSDRYDPTTYPATATDTTWASYAADADTTQPPTWQRVTPGNWDWDSLSPIHGSWSWARIWVVMYAAAPSDWTHDNGIALGDDVNLGSCPGSLGLDCNPSVIDALLDQILQRKAEHATLVNLIVSLDDDDFDPADSIGSPHLPDGHFGRWSKMDNTGAQVLARTIDGARYCARSE